MRILGVIGGVVAFVIVVAAIVLGGWWAGWWFKEQNTEKEAHIFRKSFANQERLREDASEKASEVFKIEAQLAELPPSERELAGKLEVQAEAISELACHDIGQLDELTPEVRFFADDRCKTP